MNRMVIKLKTVLEKLKLFREVGHLLKFHSVFVMIHRSGKANMWNQVPWQNNIVHQLIYAVYSVVKNHLLVYVINPIVWHLRSWKKRMTSLTILILAHDEKLWL